MRALQIRPDLVVGASVGALMGGALAALSVTDHAETGKLLEQVAATFIRADEKVALTRTLKNASKQLGTRARRIHLSPSKLRAMVRRGAEKDAGFAALGAPPALIDAFSKLLFIPHGRSRSIGVGVCRRTFHLSSRAVLASSRERNPTES
jgi:hypothetical protein